MAAPNRFSSLREFVGNNEIISGDKFFRSASVSNGYNYLKRDFLYKKGFWRGNEVRSLLSDPLFYRSKSLVLGHSDIQTRKFDTIFLNLLGIPKLFAVNNSNPGNYSESIPLGITNYGEDSTLHKILGDESHFVRANSKSFSLESFNPSIYINFTIANNNSVRRRIMSLVDDYSAFYNVTVQTPVFTENGRINYLENLRSHGLVLCPEGNGVDTHRFWETLYMGGLPVVTANKGMSFFYDNLPVLQVDTWEQLLDREHVEEKWLEISRKSYQFDILSTKYWVSKFLM